VQIDPNTQAPIGSPALSENVNAPVPAAGKQRSKKPRKVAPKRSQLDGMSEIADVEQQVADGGSSAVLESTDLEAVTRRLRSGAYNTREVAEVIARRLLSSGDL
jgi:hypothetical protein